MSVPDFRRSVKALRRAWLHWYEGQVDLPSTAGTPALQRLTCDPVINQRRMPGNTCLHALGNGATGTLDNPLNDFKGCGALMRTAPIGLLRHIPENEKIGLALSGAALTHGHKLGCTPAALLTALIGRQVFRSNSSTPSVIDITADYPCLAEGYLPLLDKALNAAADFPAPGALGRGWIAEEALAIAVACNEARQEAPLSTVISAAANHSGDSDSTAALAGQLGAASRHHDSDFCDVVFRLDAYDAIADTLALFLKRTA